MWALYQFQAAQERYRLVPTPANQRLMVEAQRKYHEVEKQTKEKATR